MTIPTETASRFAAIFAGNDAWHGTHGEPTWDEVKSKWGIRGTIENPCALTLHGAATIDHWQAHLDRKRPLGVVPARLAKDKKTVCKFGCGDVDDYAVDIVALIVRVKQMGYPLVPCRSKSGGLHLFLFLKDWEDPAAVQAVLRDMLASLGHAGAEIFPKQSHLVDDRDKGSWIVMPYFGGDYGGKLAHQHGVKPSGSDMTAEEFLAAAEGAATSVADIRVQRTPRPRAAGADATTPHRGPQVPFGDGPPCLEYLAEQGVDAGGQSNTLMMMGMYFKKSHPATWREQLEQANSLYLRPPGSAEGLMSVLRSLEKKDYFYTCRAEPMRSFCNSRLCRGRTHGVGEGSEVPKIAHVLCRDGHEKQWIVQVSGIRLTLNTQDFQEFRRFRLRAMEATPPINFSPMKEADWSALVSAAMETLMDVEPLAQQSPDVHPHRDFQEMFQAYTTNRATARRVEELGIARGKPWQDTEGVWGLPGWWYVRMTCFLRAATETDKNRYSWGRTYVRDRFEEMGGVCGEREISGQDFAVWGFPPGVVRQLALPAPVREHKEEKV